MLLAIAQRILDGHISLELASEEIARLKSESKLEWADVTAAQQSASERQREGLFEETDLIASLSLVAGERLIANKDGRLSHRIGGALLNWSGDAEAIMAYSYLLKAIAGLHANRLADSSEYLDEAIRRYGRDPRMLAEASHYRVDLLLRQGLHREAAALARQTMAEFERLGAHEEAFETALLLGRALAVLGDVAGAINALESANQGLVGLGRSDRAQRAIELLDTLQGQPKSGN